jgi:hypothetical protein
MYCVLRIKYKAPYEFDLQFYGKQNRLKIERVKRSIINFKFNSKIEEVNFMINKGFIFKSKNYYISLLSL